MSNPFDFVSDISFKKQHLLDDGSKREKEYDAFMVNRAFSYFSDTILYANAANQINNVVDKRLSHDFLFYAIRKMQRYSGSWGKKKEIENLDNIRSFFLYNNRKAIAALSILTDEQIEMIKETRKKGGLSK